MPVGWLVVDPQLTAEILQKFVHARYFFSRKIENFIMIFLIRLIFLLIIDCGHTLEDLCKAILHLSTHNLCFGLKLQTRGPLVL